LAAVERDADKKPGQAGGNTPHVSGDWAMEDWLEGGAVLEVDILLEGFAQKRSARCGDAQTLPEQNAFKPLLQGKIGPKADAAGLLPRPVSVLWTNNIVVRERWEGNFCYQRWLGRGWRHTFKVCFILPDPVKRALYGLLWGWGAIRTLRHFPAGRVSGWLSMRLGAGVRDVGAMLALKAHTELLERDDTAVVRIAMSVWLRPVELHGRGIGASPLPPGLTTLFVHGVAGPLPCLNSRRTSWITRDVGCDIARDDASLTSGVQAIGTPAGRYDSGCWKNLNDRRVWLTGKDAPIRLMFVIVRHGQKNPF
jgi:hypothetical protein